MCIDSGYHVSTSPYTTSCLSLVNFAHLFVHGLKMCMWFGFNPAVDFCHFSTLLTLSFFAGATSTSPKFNLYLYLQVLRTCIKSRMSSNFGQIGPLTTELAALQHLKISHRLIMGKCCLHASWFIFYRFIIKVAGNQDRLKSSDEFDFGPDQTAHFGVTCP